MYTFSELINSSERMKQHHYSNTHSHVFSFCVLTPIKKIEQSVNHYIEFYEVSSVLEYSLSLFRGYLSLEIIYNCTRAEHQERQLRFRLFLEQNLDRLTNRVHGLLNDNDNADNAECITVASPHLVTVKKNRFFGMFYTKRYLYGVFYTVGLF